jgi:hypothetical protein
MPLPPSLKTVKKRQLTQTEPMEKIRPRPVNKAIPNERHLLLDILV